LLHLVVCCFVYLETAFCMVSKVDGAIPDEARIVAKSADEGQLRAINQGVNEDPRV
jgi:hypothetical protein